MVPVIMVWLEDLIGNRNLFEEFLFVFLLVRDFYICGQMRESP
jgi:hypothetical protein